MKEFKRPFLDTLSFTEIMVLLGMFAMLTAGACGEFLQSNKPDVVRTKPRFICPKGVSEAPEGWVLVPKSALREIEMDLPAEAK